MSASSVRSSTRSTVLIGPTGTAWPFVSHKQSGAFFFEYNAPQDTVSWTSGNSLELLGVREQALVAHGALFLAHVHSSDRFRVESLLEASLRGDGPYVATYRWVRPDNGEVRTIHCRALLEADKTIFRGFLIDLTSEVALLSSNGDLAATMGDHMTQLHLAGVAVDSDFRIRSVSPPRDQKALSFGAPDAVPALVRPGRFLYECFESEQSQERFRTFLQEALEGDAHELVLEWEGYRAYIQRVVVQGVIAGLSMYVLDISQEQRLVAENKQLKEKLAKLEQASTTSSKITDVCQEMMGYAALISRNSHGNPFVRHIAEALKTSANELGTLSRSLMRTDSVALHEKSSPVADPPLRRLVGERAQLSRSNVIVASLTPSGTNVLEALLKDSGLHPVVTDLTESGIRDGLRTNSFVRIAILDVPSAHASCATLVRNVRRLFPALHVICLVPGPVSSFTDLRRAGAFLILSKPVGAREVERVVKGLLLLSSTGQAAEAEPADPPAKVWNVMKR